ncbi:MAG: tetratricopeptide repeat-containing sensor histidine kinase [Mucilaginibacter sp.]|uniref:tetratricopeptide repeat-containing sensor histidine kinase n=1 Tax=Mucilaginibacter sp. TaxID=1882438 RepID=UPI003264B59E
MAFYKRIILFLLAMPIYACAKPAPAGNKDATQLTIADYDKLISRYRYYKPDSAIYFTQKAIALAHANHDDVGLAKILNQLGMIEDNLGKFDESRQNYLEAIELYKRANSTKGVAIETIRLGVIENRKGNYDKALSYFLESLKISEQNKDLPGKMEAYLTISEVYILQHKIDIALKFLNQAEQINKTLPISNLSLNIYISYGNIYRETGDYDQAKSYLEKGLALSNKPEYQGLNITLMNTLAALYNKQGFKNKSIQLQKQALAKAQAIHNFIREYQTMMSIAETYGQANAKDALVYFKQALDKVKEKGAHKQAIEILGRMADMYHYLGNDKQAYAAKQEQYTIADKYFLQRMAKQIVNLQTGYDLSKSRASVKELQYLNAQQSLASKVVLGFAIGFILLLVIMGLFFYRTRKFNALLNQANAELKETNTIKDKLFSVLAHDLRAPFSTIIGLLQVINDDDIKPEERKELISLVSVTSSASLDILNNLLKWGEMQIKGIRLNPVILNPNQAIERNIAMLSGAAQVKSIYIQNQVGKDVAVVTDPDHFEFVLRNLLSNAVKFTAIGGDVTISTQTAKNGTEVNFIVQDNGVGIEPNRINRIFDLSNVSTDGTNDEKGTSLGLVLCKEFIEANHGRIWVESQPDEGSRFVFALKKA